MVRHNKLPYLVAIANSDRQPSVARLSEMSKLWDEQTAQKGDIAKTWKVFTLHKEKGIGFLKWLFIEIYLIMCTYMYEIANKETNVEKINNVQWIGATKATICKMFNE